MAVYFVLRSHYDDPSGKRLKRFDDETVLDWFRNRWDELIEEETHDHIYDELRQMLGFHPDSCLASLFEAASEDGLVPPESEDELHDYIQEHVSAEGPVVCASHAITVQHDDDELQFCYYIFDDVYAEEYPERVAYLLNDGWRLPAGSSDAGFVPSEPTEPWGPSGPGQGTTFLVALIYEDSSNLDDLPLASRIDGVRIPDLARYLAEIDPSEGNGGFLLLIRSQLLAEPITDDPAEEGFRQALLDDPEDEATWRAYSDWLQDMGERSLGLCLLEQALTRTAQFPVTQLPSSFWKQFEEFLSVQEAGEAAKQGLSRKLLSKSKIDPDKSLVQVEEHLAQICLHTDRWEPTDSYQQWIAFDDLWAAAHPDLANAILRYQRTWDVLSPDGQT